VSLENDITQIKNELNEKEKPVFKPAGEKELSRREDIRRAEARARVSANKVKGPPWIGDTPGICPVCGSDELEWGESDHDIDYVHYEFVCRDCGAEGRDEYVATYSRTIVDEDPDAHPTGGDWKPNLSQ
jgi:hypothetical protein